MQRHLSGGVIVMKAKASPMTGSDTTAKRSFKEALMPHRMAFRLTFLGLAVTNLFSMVSLLNRQIQINELLASSGSVIDQLAQFSQATVYAYILFRVLVVSGCLIFMWQVRSGRTVDGNT